MAIFKVRVISGEVKKSKSERPSGSIPTVGVSSDRYVDYTNFKDGYFMVFDEERNRYYFEDPDSLLNQPPYPELFVDEVVKNIDFDFGEY
jgi:hypothetical protein